MTCGYKKTKQIGGYKDKMNLAEKLKMEREKKGVSQTEVAQAIKVTQSAYSYFESGDRIPSTNIAIRLSRYYDVSLDYLLGED